MKSNKYVVIFSGLEDGKHSFDFKVEDDFFEEFNYTDISKGKLKVTVLLNKVGSSMTLELHIKGTVELICDRCLESFDYPLQYDGEFVIIKTDDKIENDDEINIPVNATEFDLSQQIYEYIFLGVEQRHVHPDDKDGNSTCNQRMLEDIEKLTFTNSGVDERWNELLKLKNNN